ncbi:MAG: hypothetical protein AMS16_02090 [Planctomycetes bacterium DG_58]|nr:MAG: hypothetical protein AMS16_02090 [Planctomycetes bacterium DG_58]
MKLFRLSPVVLLTALVLGCELEKERPKPPEPPVPEQKTEAPEPAPAPAPQEKTEAPKPPPMDRIKVDVKGKRIEIEGRFCLKEGILDYLAVASGGQEYESVVALNCNGSRIHSGLLAMGAKPGPTQQLIDELKKNPPKGRKVPERPGTALDISFEWKHDGKSYSVPAGRTLFDRGKKKVPEGGYWVFTGSYFAKDLEDETKEFYMADVDRALIAVLYTGSAVINFSHDAGNPYAGEDTGYEVNKALVPPEGTPVKLVITPAKKPTED